MSQRIVIDPVTRIEGHLRIECEVENGVVTNAWSMGTMWRGLENIVKGLDPKEVWEYVQRICGVCTTVHAMACVRSVEDALDLKIPRNAQYIRNMILAGHAIHDDIVHFYQLSALDWVDITSALKADPKKASDLLKPFTKWHLNSPEEFTRVQNKLKALVASGQLGIFANGYWGHPAMKLDPEVNLIAVAHYLQALECQRDANRIVAILGGKTPHIQNLAVGGVANAINPDSVAVLNLERLMYVKSFIDKLNDFVEQVYKVDTAVFAAFYPEWLEMGNGSKNYLCVPEIPTNDENSGFEMIGGYICKGDMSTYRPITDTKDEWLRKGIEESSKHAWYKEEGPFHPWEGKTNPNYSAPDYGNKYSWIKAPTFDGEQTEVGPLAHLLCSLAAKEETTTRHYNDIAESVEKLGGPRISTSQLQSTMGRIIGRTTRVCALKDSLPRQWQMLVDNIGKGDYRTFVKPNIDKGTVYKGVGFHEAPRGMLSHWTVIKNGVIENYQAVVPSTWNAAPRNQKDEMGPYEQSLIGTPIADLNKPLEVIRHIHSFDPCLSCAIHVVDTEGSEVCKVKVL